MKAAGTAIPSFTSTLLEMEPEPGVSAEDHDEFVLWTGSAIYVAGADTVSEGMIQMAYVCIALIIFHYSDRRIRESVLLLHDDVSRHTKASTGRG